MAIRIERPSGIDLSDDRVTLMLRDENGLRAGTLVIATGTDGGGNDVVKVNVLTVPGDDCLVVETRILVDR